MSPSNMSDPKSSVQVSVSLGIRRGEAIGVGQSHLHRVPWLCPPLAHSCSGRPIYGLPALTSSWEQERTSTETFLSSPAQTENSAGEFLLGHAGPCQLTHH